MKKYSARLCLAFFIRCNTSFQRIKSSKCESTLINQFLRFGTSIGANIREAFYAHGKADFIAKLQIAFTVAFTLTIRTRIVCCVKIKLFVLLNKHSQKYNKCNQPTVEKVKPPCCCS